MPDDTPPTQLADNHEESGWDVLKPEPFPDPENILARYLATLDEGAAAAAACLASTLIPTPKTLDTAAALALAIELQEEAGIALSKRRETLRRASDKKTLDALNKALEEKKLSTDHPERTAISREPQRRAEMRFGPEVESQRRMAEEKSLREREQAFAEATEKSGLPPELPCPRDNALRWALSAPPCIGIEFIDRALLDYVEHAREAMARGARMSFPESAVAYVARVWPNDRDYNEDDLCRLVVEVRPFWNSRDYEGRFFEEKRRIEEISRGKKLGGKARAAKRLRARWINYTRNFRESVGDSQNILALIETYGKQPDVALTKGREFLRTLLTAQGKPELVSTLEITLKRVGIEVPLDVATDCYTILFEEKIASA